jgi:hypothetical protein
MPSSYHDSGQSTNSSNPEPSVEISQSSDSDAQSSHPAKRQNHDISLDNPISPNTRHQSALQQNLDQLQNLPSKQNEQKRIFFDLLQNCGVEIGLKETTPFMKKVFLLRFPKGTDLLGGIFSSKKQIRRASISNLYQCFQNG